MDSSPLSSSFGNQSRLKAARKLRRSHGRHVLGRLTQRLSSMGSISGRLAALILGRHREAPLETKLLVEHLDELLRLPVHVTIGFPALLAYREWRVRYPQLPHPRRALPEAPHRRRRRRCHDRRRLGVRYLRAQHFELLCYRRGVEVVAAVAAAAAVLPLGGEEEGGVGRGVAAAELHLLGVVEGQAGVHGPAREGRGDMGANVVVVLVVVVEGDQIPDCFSCELAALE
ncbi:unnamed protein product [Musa acuminata subsp. burmannicoides]